MALRETSRRRKLGGEHVDRSESSSDSSWAGDGQREARHRASPGWIRFAGIVFVVFLVTFAVPASVIADDSQGPNLLDPSAIPKFANELTGAPPVFVPTVVTDHRGNVISHDYVVNMSAFYEQILPPGYPTTPVWGYGGEAMDAVTGAPLGFVRNSPGPTFEAVRGIPINVKWVNNVDTPNMFPVDPTLHWADPNGLNMESDVPGA